MTLWALVPIKARRHCKTRLVEELREAERIELVRTMLTQVLSALQQVPRIAGIVVLSDERDQVPTAIEVMRDRGTNLNSSLTQAMSTLRERGATRLLIMPADLPRIAPTDIELLLDAAEKSPLVIAPDEKAQGTNAVCIDAELPIQLAFGPNSFHAHVQEAKRLGIVHRVITSAGLGFDLDTGTDLNKYNKLTGRQINNQPVVNHAKLLGVNS